MKNLFNERKCLSLTEIKDYLAEKLAEDEIHDIEDHLNDCPLCSDAVEGFAAMPTAEAGKLGLPFPDRKEEKPDFGSAQPSLEERDSIDSEIPSIAPRSRKTPVRLLFFRAAAAILMLTMPLAIFLYWENSKNQLQYADFLTYTQNDFDYSLRSSDSSEMKQEPFFKALQYYDKQEYAKSLELLQLHLQDSLTDLPATFFAGVCNMYTGKPETAAVMLEKIVKSPKSGYDLDAAWYLALVKLKQGDVKRTKSLLTMLAQSDSYYNRKAAELLLVLE